MRLLSRIDGKLHVSADSDPPSRYAILSHRWLIEDEEVSFQDVKSGAVDEAGFHKPGRRKIDFCLDQAAGDGYDVVWVDSCCIDRRDRHEVGKSINKMYKYYADAAICYVYLSDVDSADWQKTLSASQWFTRGWTLQELVAPSEIRFFSEDRKYIGNKESLSRELLAITGINVRSPVLEVPIRKRFEWSLTRTTKEPEDISYCLLGILEVSIVANYGEGAEKARERLFDAIEKEHGRKAIREILATATPISAPQESMNIGQIRILLQFQNMNSRRATIADPFHDTCSWLLRHADYQAWSDMELQFLWIKGKPGAGKSTLIKFAVQAGRSDCKRISFFFNARGDSLERSVEGMYRALLHQLLAQVPSAQEPVRRLLEQEKTYTGTIVLTIPTLQAAFRTAVRSMTEPVQCFIDALDECEYSEVQEMIYFLEDVSFDTPLFVCFASRYYPSITIKSRELLLEAQEEQGVDLMSYVRGRLDAGDDLKQQVIDKANGVFFWAVLVVRLLNAETSAGRIYNVQKRLDELPSELNRLLKAITTPTDHAEELQLAVQWILFAKRPLSPNEYYLAVMIGLNMAELTDLDPLLPWPRLNPGLDMIKKFVASSSRGLAEVTRSDSPKVQFIHESVRDYLLQHGGLSEVLRTKPLHPVKWVHNELKSICFEYVAAMNIDELSNRGANAKYKFPFLEYAVVSLFFHAEEALNEVAQGAFLNSFTGQHENWLSTFYATFRSFHGQLNFTEDKHPRNMDFYVDIYPRAKAKENQEGHRGRSIVNLVDLLAFKGHVKLIYAAHQQGIRLKTTRPVPLLEAGESSQKEVFQALKDCFAERRKNELGTATETRLAPGTAVNQPRRIKAAADRRYPPVSYLPLRSGGDDSGDEGRHVTTPPPTLAPTGTTMPARISSTPDHVSATTLPPSRLLDTQGHGSATLWLERKFSKLWKRPNGKQ